MDPGGDPRRDGALREIGSSIDRLLADIGDLDDVVDQTQEVPTCFEDIPEVLFLRFADLPGVPIRLALRKGENPYARKG